MRGELGANHKIEAWLVRKRRAARRRVNRLDAIGKRIQSIEAAQKELHAITEVVVKRDFGDRHVEGNLCLRAIDLVERPFDDTVTVRIRIDDDRIVRDIRQNPDPWHKRTSTARASATSPKSAAA